MGKRQRSVQDPGKYRRVCLVLARLEVPVSHVIPDRVIDDITCFVKTIVFDVLIDSETGGLEPFDHPVIGDRLRCYFTGFYLRYLWFDEAGDIPELVAKVPSSDDFSR